MCYKDALIRAKQVTGQTTIATVINKAGTVHFEHCWDGEVVYTIKKLKSGLVVYDSKGKKVKEEKPKVEKIEKPVKKDELV